MKKNKWFDLSIFSVQITYLASIIVIAVIVSVIKPITLYIDLIIILITSIFCIYSCIKEVRNRKHRINELSKSVDVVLKNSLYSLDIPMAILTSPAQIIWQNSAAEHIIPKEFIHDTALKLEKQKSKNEIIISANDIGNGEYYSAIRKSYTF